MFFFFFFDFLKKFFSDSNPISDLDIHRNLGIGFEKDGKNVGTKTGEFDNLTLQCKKEGKRISLLLLLL
jgi:hypothetical protein